jgi:hypothetical protein
MNQCWCFRMNVSKSQNIAIHFRKISAKMLMVKILCVCLKGVSLSIRSIHSFRASNSLIMPLKRNITVISTINYSSPAVCKVK